MADQRIRSMDNNAMERRSAQIPALGRKNYYGSGAEWSGRLAAMLFSLLATLEMWGINARLWLTEYLQALQRPVAKPQPISIRSLPWNRPEAKMLPWRGRGCTPSRTGQ